MFLYHITLLKEFYAKEGLRFYKHCAPTALGAGPAVILFLVKVVLPG